MRETPLLGLGQQPPDHPVARAPVGAKIPIGDNIGKRYVGLNGAALKIPQATGVGSHCRRLIEKDILFVAKK